MSDSERDAIEANKARAQRVAAVVTAIIGVLCLAGAAGFAFDKLSGWPAAVFSGILWVVPGLFLAVLIPMQVAHFVFRTWPATITAPDGRVVSVPPDDWERPPRRWWQWVARAGLLATSMLLILADRPMLAGTYLFLFVTGPVFQDMLAVKQAAWDSHVLPPVARARYAVLTHFYRLLWPILEIPLFALRMVGWALKLIFRAFALAFGALVWLYENNIVAKRTLQACFWIVASPVIAVAMPFMLFADLRAGRKDGSDLCAIFLRPEGLVYFLYAEPHQYEYFMGDDGALDDVRDRVVARDWRKDIRARIDEYGWETFKEMPEGRMLARLELSNMRDDLPAVIVARPGKWVRAFRLSEPYRRRYRDGGKSLQNELWWMRRTLKWARNTGVAAPK